MRVADDEAGCSFGWMTGCFRISFMACWGE
jgi:hypothetical protein